MSEVHTDHEIDEVSPVSAFWRRRGILLPLVIIVTLVAAAFGYRTGGYSTAEVQVYLTDPRGVPTFRDGSSAPADMDAHASQRAEFARSVNVLGIVADEIDEPLQDLRDRVSVSASSDGSFSVFCEGDDVDEVQTTCHRIVEVYEELSRAETQRRADLAIEALLVARVRVEASRDGTQSALDQIDIQVADTESRAVLYGSGVEFLESPEPVEVSRITPAVQYGVAGAVFGLLVFGALAWWRALRRPVVASAQESAERLRGTLIGTVRPAEIADYEMVATKMQAAGLPQNFAVMRCGSPSGRDPVDALDLAFSIARGNRRVLLVDGDVVGRRLSRHFDRDSAPGLSELITGATTEGDAVTSVLERDVPMGFLGAGTPNAAAASLFRSQEAEKVFAELAQDYETIIVDTASAVTSAEGAALLSVLEGVLLVVAKGTKLGDISATRDAIDLLRTPVSGVIYAEKSR